MKHNFKGISLISVIITVLIMAILAAVMIPSGVDKINIAKLAAFNDNILTLKQETNSYFMQNDEYPTRIDGSGNPVVYSITANPSLVAEATKKGDQNDIFYIVDLDKIKIDNKDIGVGKTIDDFYIVAKTSDNVYYAKGTKIGSITYYTKQNKGDGIIAIVPTTAAVPIITPAPNGAFDGQVNAPKLAVGMTAVKWDGSTWVNADTQNVAKDWYDYTQGINKWANVKLADGSLLVWAPRYTYKMVSGEHTSTAGVIDIKFSTGTNDDITGGYRIHPAFYWGGWDIPVSAAMTKQAGGTELTGIWVGKFESSSNGGKIKIVPNAVSWTFETVGNIFTMCRGMQATNASTYGISSDSSVMDTHFLKNSEWGAVAYLSKYALGSTEVAQNTNSSYITAGGNIVTNKAESTTGNEYGIFDMSGGAIDIVASYTLSGNSGLSTYANSLLTASSKYKDVFPIAGTDLGADNYAVANQAYGYGLYETSSTGDEGYNGWFGDYTQYPEDGYAIFGRGAYLTDTLNNGLTIAGIFAFCFRPAGADDYTGFRVSIVIP